MKVATALAWPMMATVAVACATADIGPTGALKSVRHWLASQGQDPDAFAMDVEPRPCEVGGGRCYYVAAWTKDGGDGWLEFWIEPTTGEFNATAVVN